MLHWARELPDGASFAAHINREKFSSKGTRDFVDGFRANLAPAGAPTDDDTLWRLLRRFQILVFDFQSPSARQDERLNAIERRVNRFEQGPLRHP